MPGFKRFTKHLSIATDGSIGKGWENEIVVLDCLIREPALDAGRRGRAWQVGKRSPQKFSICASCVIRCRPGPVAFATLHFGARWWRAQSGFCRNQLKSSQPVGEPSCIAGRRIGRSPPVVAETDRTQKGVTRSCGFSFENDGWGCQAFSSGERPEDVLMGFRPDATRSALRPGNLE